MAAESLSSLRPRSSWSTALQALPKEPDPAAWGILGNWPTTSSTWWHDPARLPPAQALPGCPYPLAPCASPCSVPPRWTTCFDALIACTLIAAKGLPLTLTSPRSAGCAEISRSPATVPTLRAARRQRPRGATHKESAGRCTCVAAQFDFGPEAACPGHPTYPALRKERTKFEYP